MNKKYVPLIVHTLSWQKASPSSAPDGEHASRYGNILNSLVTSYSKDNESHTNNFKRVL